MLRQQRQGIFYSPQTSEVFLVLSNGNFRNLSLQYLLQAIQDIIRLLLYNTTN